MAEQWIKVSNELPYIDQEVLYYFEFTGINSGRYLGDNTFGGGRGFLMGDVTHWMPLPKPPTD